MRMRLLSLGVFALALAAVVGCGSGKVKVEGVVTLDGKPVQGALVTFVPVGTGQPATGVTNEKGEFQLSTLKAGDGAAPGEYKVTVIKSPGGEGGPAGDPKKGQGVKDMADMMKDKTKVAKEGEKAEPTPKSELPARYADKDRSGFTFKIPHQGKIQLALKSGE